MFFKKITQSWIEAELESENDLSDQRLRVRNSLIVGHLILRVLWDMLV